VKRLVRQTGARGDDLWLVQPADHPQEPRPDPQVVLGHLSTPGLGADTGGRVRSGRDRVIERQVEVRVPAAPSRRDWPRLFTELARQLDDGRIYDRDLPHLGQAIDPVLDAIDAALTSETADPGP
jgi:hypothetical protein